MMAEPTFDPRFDPAFQRGYVPPAKVPTVQPVPAAADSVDEPPAGDEPELPDVGAAEGVAPEAFMRRGVNPYVVILWVIGVIFAVGGAALLFVSFFLVYSSFAPGPSQAATLQAIYTFGSVFGVPLITVGLATIVGLIFLSAWRSWHRTEGSLS